MDGRCLHVPLCGISGPDLSCIARYAPFIRAWSPTKRDVHLT
ncbi:DUF6783 domain-containing protein [Enterocloster aldenensis]